MQFILDAHVYIVFDCAVFVCIPAILRKTIACNCTGYKQKMVKLFASFFLVLLRFRTMVCRHIKIYFLQLLMLFSFRMCAAVAQQKRFKRTTIHVNRYRPTFRLWLHTQKQKNYYMNSQYNESELAIPQFFMTHKPMPCENKFEIQLSHRCAKLDRDVNHSRTKYYAKNLLPTTEELSTAQHSIHNYPYEK